MVSSDRQFDRFIGFFHSAHLPVSGDWALIQDLLV